MSAARGMDGYGAWHAHHDIPILSTKTWADGYGNWHASVDHMAGTDVQNARVARAAILAELLERVGSQPIDTRRLTVKLERTTSHGTAIYVETWRAPRVLEVLEVAA